MRMKHWDKRANPSSRYVCEFCDYESVSEMNLMKHEEEVHMRTKPKSGSEYKNKSVPTNGNHKSPTFPCDMCNFNANNDRELNNHLENTHKFNRVFRRRTGYSMEERKLNGICIHWNNGSCQCEELCKFAHEEIPQCFFDILCRRENCKFFHTQQSPQSGAQRFPFLSKRGLQNPHFNQRKPFQGGQRGQRR